VSVDLKKNTWPGPWPFVAETVTLVRKYRSVIVTLDGVQRALNGMAFHTEGLALPTVPAEQLEGVNVGPMIQYGLKIKEGE